jgi:hypothetical protein
MAKNELFWTAGGVVQVDGKDYGINDALPVDKIDKDKLDRWKKDKKVGEKIAPVVKDGRDNQIAELKAELKEVKAEVKRLTAELAEATKPVKDGKKK